MLSSLLLKEWFVLLSFHSIVLMYPGLASMEKTTDHCNIFVDELECNLVLVFHCKQGEEKEGLRKREREIKRQRERQKQGEKERERERERKAGKEVRNDDILEKKLLCIH